MERMKKQNGITLIALVITIIVLLILAGIAISMLSGDNGLLKQAADAKVETEHKSLEEQIKLAAKDALMRGKDLTSIENEGDLNDALVSQGLSEFTLIKNATDGYTVETKKGTYEVLANGIIKEVVPIEKIAKDKPYVDYYANLDDDPEPEGIIYADLAIAVSGEQWTDANGSYSYGPNTGIKDYYISKKAHNGPFGEKDVLTATGEGEDRFYVMDLESFNGGEFYCWYYQAYWTKVGDYSAVTSPDFGKGITNTSKMMEKWNGAAYGTKNANAACPDIWGAIEEKVADGWFIPSRGEWAAFANNLKITTDNYDDYLLPAEYWSSSLVDGNDAWCINFSKGKMDNGGNINGDDIPLRFSTTF